MAKAEISKVLNVSLDKLFATICAYDKYPEFVDNVKSTTVERLSDTKAKVTYKVSLIKDVEYSLELNEKRDGDKATVSWKLLEGKAFQKNDGGWKLESVGPDKTKIHYHVDVDFNFPAPGFVIKSIVSGTLPGMIQAFEERARGRG